MESRVSHASGQGRFFRSLDEFIPMTIGEPGDRDSLNAFSERLDK